MAYLTVDAHDEYITVFGIFRLDVVCIFLNICRFLIFVNRYQPFWAKSDPHFMSFLLFHILSLNLFKSGIIIHHSTFFCYYFAQNPSYFFASAHQLHIFLAGICKNYARVCFNTSRPHIQKAGPLKADF